MIMMAALGAAVLAMVSWVALREAQRLQATRGVGAPPKADVALAGRRVASASGDARVPPPGRALVEGDATVADADTDEALAAAAALWHVLVDAERG